METYPDFLPDFGLKESPSREYTPPHNYQRIVIPTCGYDVSFNQQLADLMEWNQISPEEKANLSFLIQESYRQMGDCYDSQHSNFFYKLQGNPGDPAVRGYPSFDHLSNINWENKWPGYVTIFRHTALEFFATVNPYQKMFPNMEFIYNKYIPTGWIFYLAPRRFYDI